MKHAIVSRLLVASAFFALLIAGPVGAAGKKVDCRGAEVPVSVGKRTTCQPIGKVLPKPREVDPRLAHLQETLKFDPARTVHGNKRKRARTLQSGFGAVGKRAQKKLLKALPKALAFLDRKKRKAGASGLGPGPAFASAGCQAGEAGPIGHTGGASVGLLGDNGGYIEASAGGGLRVRITFASCGGVGNFHLPQCPTADGSVDGKGTGQFQATIEIWDGNKLVSRNSSVFTDDAKVLGKVGADGKLKSIDVEHTQEIFIIASGGIAIRGGVTRKVRIDMPAGRYDPEQASVAYFGDKISSDSGADGFASTASHAITAYKNAEPHWSTFSPPYCAEPVFSPDSNTLKLSKGKTGRLSIYAKGQDGGRATGANWTLLSPENADFSPTSSQDAAPGISYTVTDAPKGGQVKVTVKFTSTAGVGEKTWTQPIGGGIQHISGTFSGHWEGPSYTGGPNYHFDFSGKASFDRRPGGTYPARFDLVSGSISENYSGETDPESEDRPACQVNGHADRTLPPSEENYFELTGSGSSHSDPPFAYTIWLIEVTGEGEVTYSECKYEFDEGTESGTGQFYGEVFLGHSEDEFTFVGSQGVPEGVGEINWSFTGTP